MNRLFDSRETRQFLVVMAFAGVVRACLFIGFYGGDDREYYPSAVELSSGEFNPVGAHWQARLGVIAPMALLFRWFGSGIVVGVLPMFLCSLGTVALAYFVAKHFTKQTSVALVAATLVSLYPLDALMATQVFPGAGVAAFTALAFYCFSVAESSKNRWLFYLAGLALGAAYTMRITSMFAVLPWVVWVVFVRRKVTAGDVIAALGVASVMVVESFAFVALGQDPLYRFDVLLGSASGVGESLGAIRPGGMIFSPVIALLTNQEFGILPVFTLASLIYFAIRREQRMFPVAMFLVLVVVYTMWGSSSLSAYRPLRPWPRYLTAATVPAAVLVASFLCSIQSKRLRRSLTTLLLVSFLGGFCLDDSWAESRLARTVLQVMDEEPEATCILYDDDYMAASAFSGFRPRENAVLLQSRRYLRSSRLGNNIPQIHMSEISEDDRLITRGTRSVDTDRFALVATTQVPPNRLTRLLRKTGTGLGDLMMRLRPPQEVRLYRLKSTEVGNASSGHK